MTESLSRDAGHAILRLEYELLVRDFLDLLDEGCWRELRAFLHDDVRFVTSPHRRVEGRERVVSAVAEIREAFEIFDVRVIEMGFGSGSVFAQLQLSIGRSDDQRVEVLSFARFQMRDMQIVEWTQTYA